MANPPSYLHTVTSHPRSGHFVEVTPQSDSDDGILLQSEHQLLHQLDVNHAESYHGHGVGYDYGHWTQYCDNAPYQGPPPSAVNLDGQLDGQYAFIRNPGPNTDYPPSGNDQDNLVASASGPSHGVYHPPPVHAPQDMSNDGVRDHAPLMLDFANSFSQSVPDSPPSPSGTLAMESLKRLVDRYLHDPGSRMDTLRMGLSPSGGRLRVTIMFDIDV
ncbi:hypothetical protein EDB84DRAFT_1677613 [Lactarius hengduanensis]|nr:hypothetical protein EDB84DRAFT_1677613 [Lactarius hengduanensis]